MSSTVTLTAEARLPGGKGRARAARRAGQLPAIIYGGGEEPRPISLNFRSVSQQFQTGSFMSTPVEIDLAGKKIRALPRQVQLEPVRDALVHVDFLRLGEGAEVTVDVPVHFFNEEASPGLKRGGVLNIVRHTVELNCPADSIPDRISIDLEGLDIGDSVHISRVSLPAGVTPVIQDRDFTIATIAAPAVLAEPVAEAATEEEAEEEAQAPKAEDGGET